MNRITVLDDYQGVVARLDSVRVLDGLAVELDVLTRRISDENELLRVLRDTDTLVLIRERTRISSRLIAALPRLRLIVQTGRLSDCIDLAACARHGVAVRDGSGNPIAPAELTWALILAASRRLVGYAGQLARGRWQRSTPELADEQLGRALCGRTLGIWGYGRIGRRVAAVGDAFGMRVVAHGREQSQQAAEADGVAYLADRRDFLAQVDVLSLHLRLCAETRHLIRRDDLAAMRPDALLVNTSRAELLAPRALLDALGDGRPGAAAIDVFECEPDGVGDYLDHPCILCTPHLGFVEQDTYEAYFREAFTHVRDFIRDAGGGSAI
ncbi:D-2-hydroxyacid dehydrogenase family protein [Azospira restricta]|uniref:D-2-hydroxyacid dehydrogenase family protein n=1 Tax=Azospira restricta TaxID=404405 RepID=A0A974SNE8_9RHOO|nr:D-2-hydroxyacid dehydrogenase family protein [Azospira restricta]QRJ63294.1 D-2-hydroxyacid dehydrogenase family protein [Azospira restricta]